MARIAQGLMPTFLARPEQIPAMMRSSVERVRPCFARALWMLFTTATPCSRVMATPTTLPNLHVTGHAVTPWLDHEPTLGEVSGFVRCTTTVPR